VVIVVNDIEINFLCMCQASPTVASCFLTYEPNQDIGSNFDITIAIGSPGYIAPNFS